MSVKDRERLWTGSALALRIFCYGRKLFSIWWNREGLRSRWVWGYHYSWDLFLIPKEAHTKNIWALPDLTECEFLPMSSSLWAAPNGTNGSCLSNLIFIPVYALHVCPILRCSQILRQQKDISAVMAQIDILKGNASFLFHPGGCTYTKVGTELVHCYAASVFTMWFERKRRFILVTCYFPCPLLSLLLPLPSAHYLYCSFPKPKGRNLKRRR